MTETIYITIFDDQDWEGGTLRTIWACSIGMKLYITNRFIQHPVVAYGTPYSRPRINGDSGGVVLVAHSEYRSVFFSYTKHLTRLLDPHRYGVGQARHTSGGPGLVHVTKPIDQGPHIPVLE